MFSIILKKSKKYYKVFLMISNAFWDVELSKKKIIYMKKYNYLTTVSSVKNHIHKPKLLEIVLSAITGFI